MRLKSFITESNYNIQKDFMKWTEKIWGERLFDQIKSGKIKVIFNEDPKNQIVMGVRYNPRAVRRFGSTILSFAPKYEVLYNPRIFDEDRNTYEKIIRHEVLHLGFTKHDKDFRRAAKKWDTAPTEKMIKSGDVELQVRVKPRKYKTIETFNDPDEATLHVKYKIFPNKEEVERIKREHGIEGKLAFRIRY